MSQSKYILFFSLTAFLLGTSWISWFVYAAPYDDLPTFYWATQLSILHDISPYQYRHFLDLKPVFGQKIYPFLYPPISVLVFFPLLWCDNYDQCKDWFSIVNLFACWLAVGGLILIYQQYARKPQILFPSIFCILMIGYLPVADTFRTGQINLLAFLLILPCFFRADSLWKNIVVGSLLACAVALKIYLLVLLPVLWFFEKKREVIICVMIVATLVLLSMYCLPQSMWVDWFTLVQQSGYGRRVPQVLTIPFNQSLNGFFIRLSLAKLVNNNGLLWVYGAILACGLLAGYCVLLLKKKPKGISVALALILLLINLIAPLTWAHHFVFALPSLVVGFALLCETVLLCRLKALLAACFFFGALLVAAPYLPNLFVHELLGLPGFFGNTLIQELLLSTQLTGAAVVFLTLCFLIIKDR